MILRIGFNLATIFLHLNLFNHIRRLILVKLLEKVIIYLLILRFSVNFSNHLNNCDSRVFCVNACSILSAPIRFSVPNFLRKENIFFLCCPRCKLLLSSITVSANIIFDYSGSLISYNNFTCQTPDRSRKGCTLQ